jgi:hypothetical protein
MLFGIPGEEIQVRLNGGEHLDWWGVPATHDGLRDALQELGLPAVLLLFVGLGLAMEHPTGRATVAMDDLIRAIGVEPRSTAERCIWRGRIWGWLLMFENMPVVGKRPGKYRDPKTRKLIDLVSADPLMRVTGTRQGEQRSLDGSTPPLEVSIVLGEWAMHHCGNRQVLTTFGELLRIAKIPGGKPSGAWAQSIGMALQQRWRERSATADVREVGDERHLTARFGKAFTRRDLLTLYPPSPSVDEVLARDHPDRARKYWSDAIGILRDIGVIGHYQELAPRGVTRQGWAEAWLDQPLDIRPTRADVAAVAEISASAATARGRKVQRARKTLPDSTDG